MSGEPNTSLSKKCSVESHQPEQEPPSVLFEKKSTIHELESWVLDLMANQPPSTETPMAPVKSNSSLLSPPKPEGNSFNKYLAGSVVEAAHDSLTRRKTMEFLERQKEEEDEPKQAVTRQTVDRGKFFLIGVVILTIIVLLVSVGPSPKARRRGKAESRKARRKGK